MKRAIFSLLAVLVVATILLLFKVLIPSFQFSKTLDNIEESFGFEEKPDEVISPEEVAVNKRHLERSLKSGADFRNTNSASYANGQLTGSWEQFQFLSAENQHYGYRVDASLYDKENDVIYAISSAGHLYRINRQSGNDSNTQWELLNHKEHFLWSTVDWKWRYVDGLNKPDGAFRMIRSEFNGMQYSDNEGRDWINAFGEEALETSKEGAIVKTASGNRIYVLFKTSSTKQQVFVSDDDGITYSALPISFNPNSYYLRLFKVHNSESVFLAAYNNSDSKISIYEHALNDTEFSLLSTSNNTFVTPNKDYDQIFGTYHNGTYHFYIGSNRTQIYHSDDLGLNWTNKEVVPEANYGITNIREVKPTDPNTIFRGFLDLYVSKDLGTTWSGFGHYLGWDVQHMRYYQRKDGSYFLFVGKDFGCYISNQPELASSYISLNNNSPIQMCYDADHSQNYYTSFTATQDRGTMGFSTLTNVSSTQDVKTTDGLRVTLANSDLSVWTWMYYGSIFHKTNFIAGKSAVTGIHGRGNWWAAPMIQSPNINEDVVYLAYGSKLSKLTFNPVQNSIIETSHYFDFTEETGSKISGFGYSSINTNRWFVSVKDGTFLYSEDGGQTFTKTTYNGTKPWTEGGWHKNQHIIRASGIDENTVFYAGVGNVFLISKDGGKTFSNHNNGLDIYRIRDFDVSADEKFIFAACGTGGIWVYSVDDDSWYPMVDSAVPYVQFTDVEFMAKKHAVKFATYGSGVLTFSIDKQDEQINYPDQLTSKITPENYVKIQWEDQSNNEDGFIIERAKNSSFTTIATVVANQVNYIDTELLEPGFYQYRVKAYAGNDQSHYSNYAVVEVKAEDELSKEGWQLVSVDSEEINYGAALAFDGDESTMWHTQWQISPKPNHPHELVIDMNETIDVYGFSYLPRQDNSWNGIIKDFEFYLSLDNNTWIKVASGSWEKTREIKNVYFSNHHTARYLKLKSLNEVNGTVFASCAEIAVMNHLQTPSAPNAPQFIQGGRLNDTEIELIWLDLSKDEDGFVIEQLIDASFSPIFTSGKDITSYTIQNTDENSSYTFRVTAFNENGTSPYSDELKINAVIPVKVENVPNNFKLQIYPNPFENELKIELGTSNAFSSWQIIDFTGKVWKAGRINKGEKGKSIKLDNLEAGVYVIRIRHGDSWVSKTIVKR